MRIPSVLGLIVCAALLVAGLLVMATHAPGLYVLCLAAWTFGAGPLYGAASDRLIHKPWRHARGLQRVADLARPDVLDRALTRIGWNSHIRAPIGGRGDLPRLRRNATNSLLSHGVSTGLHAAAALGLVVIGHPGWGVVALVTGLVIHTWPALLQVRVLSRLDRLQAQLLAPR